MPMKTKDKKYMKELRDRLRETPLDRVPPPKLRQLALEAFNDETGLNVQMSDIDGSCIGGHRVYSGAWLRKAERKPVPYLPERKAGKGHPDTPAEREPTEEEGIRRAFSVYYQLKARQASPSRIKTGAARARSFSSRIDKQKAAVRELAEALAVLERFDAVKEGEHIWVLPQRPDWRKWNLSAAKYRTGVQQFHDVLRWLAASVRSRKGADAEGDVISISDVQSFLASVLSGEYTESTEVAESLRDTSALRGQPQSSTILSFCKALSHFQEDRQCSSLGSGQALFSIPEFVLLQDMFIAEMADPVLQTSLARFLPDVKRVLIAKEAELKRDQKAVRKGIEPKFVRQALVRRLLTVRMGQFTNAVVESDLWAGEELGGAEVPPLFGGTVIEKENEEALVELILRKRFQGEANKGVFLTYDLVLNQA